jgi:flavorubredoxin
MVKVFVFYDSKYGNTKLAAEKVAEGMRAAGAEVSLGYVKEVRPEAAADYDAIVLGAPNHMASPSRAMKSFIDELAKVELKAGFVAVFGTYAGRERLQDRAEKKLEAMGHEKLPKLKLLLPGLSVHVRGVSGPIVDGELPRCVEFGKKLARQIR